MTGWLLLDQDVLGLEITVRDILGMHGGEATEHLLAEMLDALNRDGQLRLFSLTQLILQTAFTELHDDVLNESLFLVERIEELDELHHVRCILEKSHHFILSRDNVASLLCSLNSNLDVPVLIEGLEDEPYEN